MKQLTGEPKKRLYWLDVARVIAIISISCNHAVNRSYAIYEGQGAEFASIPFASTLFKTAVYIFSRLGVPVFLMISGALLLKKDIKDAAGVRTFYRHNLLGLFITVEIWYVIDYVFYWRASFLSGAVSPVSAVVNLIPKLLFLTNDDSIMASFWYLPMILCIYLLIPFICISKDRFGKRAFIPASAVLFYMGFAVSTLNLFSGLFSGEEFSLPERAVLASLYIIYLLAGYVISQGYLKKIKSVFILTGFVFGFAVSCAFQAFAFYKDSKLLVSYDSIFILVTSVFLFELIKRYADKLLKLRRPVEYLSRIAFGIYFVHIFIMTILKAKLPGIESALPQPAYFFFLEAVSVAGAVIIIAITSKIPFVKKYVYMIK